MDNKGTVQNFETADRNESNRWGAFVFWFLAGCLLLGLDQTSKSLAFRFPGRLNFGFWLRQENFINERFAFSLPVPEVIMAAVYTLVLGLFAWYVFREAKKFNRLQAGAATLILAGGLSNIAERYFLGGVRDFIYLWGGIFNLADFYILAGIALLLAYSAWGVKELPVIKKPL